jgi:hypothetical protein
LAEVPADARVAADTTTPEGAAAAFAACREQLGAAPSWLAHAVGSTLLAPLHRTRAEAAREVLRVNLESSLWTLQAWIAALEGAPGAAVFASSVVARIGVANHEVIAAAKGGVEALVRGAAATYAAQGLPARRDRARHRRAARPFGRARHHLHAGLEEPAPSGGARAPGHQPGSQEQVGQRLVGAVLSFNRTPSKRAGCPARGRQ